MHAQGRLITQLLLWMLLAEPDLFTRQETIRTEEGCQQKSMRESVTTREMGEQDADCPGMPEMCRKDSGPADTVPCKQHLLVAKEALTTIRTVTGCVLWTKHCALCPQVRQGFPFCLTHSHLKITYAAL